MRGIIEFSNYCERNCLYCGLRTGNPKLRRYRMTEDEIIATATQVMEMHVPTVVLRSGANVVMPDFTPLKYKSLYDIYPCRADVGRPANIVANLKIDLASISRTILFGEGYRSSK